ncbi:hypothetical protein V5F31_08190 [Xanthobacter sp. V7C-4]|uniref:hypothetical protein n=1 Tax=Xanthobacter autotrophicus (strain ATCC BAA-1158 / Py2) TaxID=78245 RepID=UPI0037264CCC
MSWFERLTGFQETGYQQTRDRLHVHEGRLHSPINGRSYGIGMLELVSLEELRRRATDMNGGPRLSISFVQDDVRRLHRQHENAGALFQVASQFNLLEMVSHEVSPEDGVARYEYDPTQGPACAIAAGAATVFRNYFAPVGNDFGQTRQRQLDGLADLGTRLAALTGRPVRDLWDMRNGYALCASEGLSAIETVVSALNDAGVDGLRGLLRVGVHAAVEVTDAPERPGQCVTQVFCSALPVSYQRKVPKALWSPLARLVLEAAYEAALLAAMENRARGGSPRVYLTRLGGGAFGNDDRWINDAILRALELARTWPLDVRIVARDIRATDSLPSQLRERGLAT